MIQNISIALPSDPNNSNATYLCHMSISVWCFLSYVRLSGCLIRKLHVHLFFSLPVYLSVSSIHMSLYVSNPCQTLFHMFVSLSNSQTCLFVPVTLALSLPLSCPCFVHERTYVCLSVKQKSVRPAPQLAQECECLVGGSTIIWS